MSSTCDSEFTAKLDELISHDKSSDRAKNIIEMLEDGFKNGLLSEKQKILLGVESFDKGDYEIGIQAFKDAMNGPLAVEAALFAAYCYMTLYPTEVYFLGPLEEATDNFLALKMLGYLHSYAGKDGKLYLDKADKIRANRNTIPQNERPAFPEKSGHPNNHLELLDGYWKDYILEMNHSR